VGCERHEPLFVHVVQESSCCSVLVFHAALDERGVLSWYEKSSDIFTSYVRFEDIENLTWWPYTPEPVIRPENAGELWKQSGVYFMLVSDGGCYLKSCCPNQKASVSGWKAITHGKYGWERIHPKVKREESS